MRLLVLAVLAFIYGQPASAQQRYDGRWSVLVITQQGSCDVYRWELLVDRGRISSPAMPVQAEGGVDRNGTVRVRFRRGGETLTASGRISGYYGAGRWSAPSRQCAGSWRAEKRG